jgi:uncharacterized protein YwgA
LPPYAGSGESRGRDAGQECQDDAKIRQKQGESRRMGKLLDYFERVYGQKYDDGKQNHRIAIQKIVYLAESRGLSIGNHWFIWKDRGPFSPDLRLDVLDEVNELGQINVSKQKELLAVTKFSEFAEEILSEDAETMRERNDENERVEWIELIASLHFFATKEMRYAPRREVYTELLKEKPQYDDKEKWNLDDAWARAEKIMYA